jgi:hypothetical protein
VMMKMRGKMIMSGHKKGSDMAFLSIN